MKRINPYKLFVGCFLPNWLVRRKELSHGAKLCYARLAQYGGEQGDCHPHQDTLATELGVHARQVRRYVAELVTSHLIDTDVLQYQGNNRYYFLWHPWMEIDPPQDIYDLSERSDMSSQDPPDRSDMTSQIGQICPPEENHRRESKKKRHTLSPKPHKPVSAMSVDECIESWNEICASEGLPEVTPIGARNQTLRKKIQSRLREHPDIEFWGTVMNTCWKSPFLRGDGERGWKVTLRWLVENDHNALKVYEGHYNGKSQ